MALPSEAPTWVAVLAGAVFCGGPLAVLVGAWVYQFRQPEPEQAMAGQQEEGGVDDQEAGQGQSQSP